MKLTLDEARALADSRFVDVENQVQLIKSRQALWSTSELLRQARELERLAQAYAEAVDATDDKEMEMMAEEAEAEYEGALYASIAPTIYGAEE